MYRYSNIFVIAFFIASAFDWVGFYFVLKEIFGDIKEDIKRTWNATPEELAQMNRRYMRKKRMSDPNIPYEDPELDAEYERFLKNRSMYRSPQEREKDKKQREQDQKYHEEKMLDPQMMKCRQEMLRQARIALDDRRDWEKRYGYDQYMMLNGGQYEQWREKYGHIEKTDKKKVE